MQVSASQGTMRSSVSAGSLATLNGMRSTKSTCGSQVSSMKSSSPSFSFGSGPARIQFTGPASRSAQTLQASVPSGGDQSPGPIYNPAPASKWMGDAPHSHFGTQQQRPMTGAMQTDVSKLTGKSNTPGPGAYPQPAAVGKQPLGRCNSYPTFSFGTQRQRESAAKATASPGPVYEPRGARYGSMERSSYSFGNEIRQKNRDPSLRTPGPGNYNSRSACGTQVYSLQRTAPASSFGPAPAKMKVGRGELPLEGRSSPGPIYMNAPACRKQTLSDKRSAANAAFSRAQRFAGLGGTGASPGPGEYIV
jgi:hypothetical protein